jgi:mannose-6-phosphate isomerase class I
MAQNLSAPWQVKDALIEQPSWGGRYIVDLKGLTDDPAWKEKKVGQSYEMAKASVLLDPSGEEEVALHDLIASDPAGVLGQKVLDKFGPDLSLLIKLTQAKGNSFQVHLPEGQTLGHWVPKPEAWFYLAPGLYTFGLKAGTDFEAYSRVLHTIDDDMGRLSREVQGGRFTVDDARAQAGERIKVLDPFAYVNLVEAETDDVIDLTAGGIHHSWEDDPVRFPNGNLVYEVQVDVPDDKCSMRGFDKGKILDDGSLRPTHIKDYLATINQDPAHNQINQHVRKPEVVSEGNGAKTESLFRTAHFNTDRVTITAGSSLPQSLADGFHHVFVHAGEAKVGGQALSQGRSYVFPAAMGEYTLTAGGKDAVLLKTYLPV